MGAIEELESVRNFFDKEIRAARVRKKKIAGAIATFNRIIDAVESRCLAADGPVTPTLREMRENELAALWESVQVIKRHLPK